MVPILFFSAIVLFSAAYIAWPFFITRQSPASDVSRIKAAYESEARHIVNIKRSGSTYGGRSDPSYRVYQIDVDDAINGHSRHRIGVEATLFGYPGVVEFDNLRQLHPNQP